MSLYFMVLPDWFQIQLFMTSLYVISYLFIVICMPESPKWCLIKGNTEGAL
jgi:hypothetical protein